MGRAMQSNNARISVCPIWYQDILDVLFFLSLSLSLTSLATQCLAFIILVIVAGSES